MRSCDAGPASAPRPGSPAAGCPGPRRSSRRRRRSRRSPAAWQPALCSSSISRSRSQRFRRGCSTVSTSAIAMNTGTIALNAEAGSTSSSTAPVMPPSTDIVPSRSDARALAGQLAPVADGARDRPRDQADRVRDVGRHRRISEREQHREGDQRAAADDRVDHARPPGPRRAMAAISPKLISVRTSDLAGPLRRGNRRSIS